jgi:hydroxymethylglutaryl-CoA reductase (NADPH)
MIFEDTRICTTVPTKIVGPIRMNYELYGNELVHVPLASFEIPIWSAVKRGALVSQKTDGIRVAIVGDGMTRAILMEATDIDNAIRCQRWIESNFELMKETVSGTSRFANLLSIHIENVGRLLYIRLSVETGNASGHNMVTKAADAIANVVMVNCSSMRYVSVSGNYCTDKKNSAVNGILGRGKRVSAEIVVDGDLCRSLLRVSPETLVDLNVKKNLIGSILSGGVRSANAHFVNVVLAMYLATGQDSANIVEASQGITHVDFDGTNLYFSVNIFNMIVGTVGNGKNQDFAVENLKLLKCYPEDPLSSKRLAAIIASAVLCAELSLLAAQTNAGELTMAHMKLERS